MGQRPTDRSGFDPDQPASPVGGQAVLGGGAGFVVGLFAPPLLLVTAVGAGIAIVDDTHADRVDRALVRASKKVQRAVDSGDAEKLRKALDDASHDVSRAIDS